MVAHVGIGLALRQEIKVLLDQAFASPEEKSDLAYLHLLLCQLSTADERGQIVADRLGRMMHDVTDLRHGFAFQ